MTSKGWGALALLAGLIGAAGLIVSAAPVTDTLAGGSSAMTGASGSAGPAGPASPARETVTLGGGCFWCMEAVFADLEGVEKVESGYAGGKVANPTYEQVCTGKTGHAEVVQITFDPAVIPLAEILDIFFQLHDPTTLNRQGADVGTQYRSVVFYRSPEQKAAVEKAIHKVEKSGLWDGRVVTEIAPFTAFYPAEDYHQRYYEQNGSQPYCRLVIAPKMKKLRERFGDWLKKH